MADQACRACKRQKRRCDKGLPECGLCRRTRRLCEYVPNDTPEPPPSARDLAALRDRLEELEDRLASSAAHSPSQHGPSSSVQGPEPSGVVSPGLSSTASYRTNGQLQYGSSNLASAALFLDLDCFVWSRLRLPVPTVAIPMEVLAMLSQGNAVVDASQDYFATIHTWLPIVSKKRMDMGIPVRDGGPDLAMLFLAMRLLVSKAEDPEEPRIYALVKGFLATLEQCSVVSLLCLQAMVLVALYEYSNAIYPAAWMTVAACARYADILGLSDGRDMPFLSQATTWTEVEERRRVWWGIFILDRLVSTGGKRSCVLPEPTPECRLPVDDQVWDSGEMMRAVSQAVSVPYHVEQSSFARLCQAALYLGRALHHARNPQAMSLSRIAGIQTLVDELSGFCAVVDAAAAASSDTNETLLGPCCVARSALFVALDAFTCPEKLQAGAGYAMNSAAKTHDELGLQTSSMQTVQMASNQIHELALRISASTNSITGDPWWELSKISPFVLDVVYCSTVTYHWLLGESGTESHRVAVEDLNAFMDMFGTRWRLASRYRETADLYDVSTRLRGNTVL